MKITKETFVVGAAALAAAGTWFGWLGWDHAYQVDPVAQVASGPYETWQAAGAGACLVAVLVAALAAGARPLLASGAVALGFVTGWTIDAARSDETGLYAAGALFLLVGLAAAGAVVSAVTLAVLHQVAPRRGRSPR